jgi:P-type Ca2+ transporter type 2C
LPILLTPLNVVWLELIVHSVSALVFEGRDAGEDVMARPPLDPNRSIVPLGAGSRSAICGALLAIGALGAFAYCLRYGEAYARSLAMLIAIIGSVLLILAEFAGDQPWWKTELPRDVRFWTVCVAAAATPLLFASVPPLASPLGLAALAWRTCAVALAIAGFAVGWRSFGWSTQESQVSLTPTP